MRKTAFAARKSAHVQGLDGAACAMLAQYLASLGTEGCVAGYMPIRTEINPLSVMRDLDAAGRVVCVPVIEAAGKPLLFSRWREGGAMTGGPFGATVPASADYVEPDIIVTPLVAFDRRGFRLGYGGGYYDRTLEKLRQKKRIIAIGFAYGAQELPTVPTEPTDQRLDAVVTQSGVLSFDKTHALPSWQGLGKPSS
ncbi:MAG: 5-formyltetrahydrofolate cyclo-ligase [Paracoccaceae bacterium]